MDGKKIPMIKDDSKLVCTVCLLPMQYQSKQNDSFVWQCFKCGKKYFVVDVDGNYNVKESWSSPK